MPDFCVTIECLVTHIYAVECAADNEQAAREAAMHIMEGGTEEPFQCRYDGPLTVIDVKPIEYEADEDVTKAID